jgi:outer membrane protein assembly factor BamB
LTIRHLLTVFLSLLAVVSYGAVADGGISADGLATQDGEQDTYWHQWRGPLATGVAPAGDPPVRWGENLNVAWKIEIPGRGSATPVVWEDRIFVLTAVAVQDGEPSAPMVAGHGGGEAAKALEPQRRRGGGVPPTTQDLLVLAIDRASGEVVWQQTARQETPHESKQANNSWASASAITDGTHVIAYFGSRGLYCYDMDGNLVWERDLGDMQTRGAFGEGASPALHGNTIVLTWDHEGQSFIVALDKNTGEELWRDDRDEPTSWATPLVVDHEGRPQAITGATNRVRSYDLETGSIVWEGDGLTLNVIPSPVAADGVVYLMSGYRGNALQAISLERARGDLQRGDAVLWEHDRDTPYVSSPLLYGDTLYFVKSNSGILSAFDVTSGDPHYGPVRLDGISEVYASPVGVAERVYILGRDGNALVLSHGPELLVLAQNSLDDGFDASPAIVGDEIYLRGYRHLYRISED